MAAMTYRPYKYNGFNIRFVSNNGNKHLVVKDVSKVLGLGRPMKIVKLLNPKNYYKAKVVFPGICAQTMLVLTSSGLQELIDKKCDAYKIRGFRSWLRERNLLPAEQVITTGEGVDAAAEFIGYTDVNVDINADAIENTNQESSNESLFNQVLQWLKACPIDLKRAL